MSWLGSSPRLPQLTSEGVFLFCRPCHITVHTVAGPWHLGANYPWLGLSPCRQGSHLSRFQEPHRQQQEEVPGGPLKGLSGPQVTHLVGSRTLFSVCVVKAGRMTRVKPLGDWEKQATRHLGFSLKPPGCHSCCSGCKWRFEHEAGWARGNLEVTNLMEKPGLCLTFWTQKKKHQR